MKSFTIIVPVYSIVYKAPIRLELMHNGFADRSLTAWVRRPESIQISKKRAGLSSPAWGYAPFGGSGRPAKPDSNNRKGMFGQKINLFITFILVCFAWIFFRANTIADAFLIITKLAKLPAELAGYVKGLSQIGIVRTIRMAFQIGMDVANPIYGFGLINAGLSGVCIIILLVNDILIQKTPKGTVVKQKPLVLRWILRQYIDRFDKNAVLFIPISYFQITRIKTDFLFQCQ